jgi:hypothetical protein
MMTSSPTSQAGSGSCAEPMPPRLSACAIRCDISPLIQAASASCRLSRAAMSMPSWSFWTSVRLHSCLPVAADSATAALLVAAYTTPQLYITVRTVSSHLDRIRDKTGCRRRADLTRLALSSGLV